jgi:hypothetical protein
MTAIRSLLAAAAAVTSSSIALAQGPCIDHGWCHFAPLVPDPITQGALFGWSLDVLGDTAVVCSLAGNVVSVYERVGSDWLLVQLLEDPHAGDNQFGANVALSEDFIAVGAHLDDTAGPNAGAVHVYRREAGTWVFDETLTSITPSANGNFGLAVDVDGIWLAVGAPGEASGGRVHAYLRTFAWWFRITGLSTATSVSLGSCVAIEQIDGQTEAQIVAGDPHCDEAGDGAGRISTLRVRPFGYYHETLLSPVPQAGANFGWDVDLQGDTIVVSSLDASIGGVTSGAVDVFDVDLSVLDPDFDHVQRLTPCSAAGSPIDSNASFGFAVALDGDRLAVGVPGRDAGTTLGGAVEIYRPNPLGSGFTRDGHVFAEGAVADENFGWDVALSGNTLLVAAWGNDISGGNHGAVYPVSLASKSVVGGACPCDCLASAVHYGTGKAGTNGVPTLDALGVPVPGESLTLRVANAFVGATPIVVWGLVPAAVPFDGGVILVEDLHLEFLPTIGPIGQVGIGWGVPADPATCGLDVFVQAFMFDPGASGMFALAHTDGLRLTVGY